MSRNSSGAVPRDQYTWMYLSNVVVLVAGLLVYHLAGRYFGTGGFAEYALARRATNLLAPALMLGIGIALPRQLAVLLDPATKRAGRIFFVSFVLVSSACLVMTSLGIAFPGLFAELLLGDSSLAELAVPLMLFLGGLSWHSTLWAYFRGTFRFRAASLLDIGNLAVIPIVGFAVAGGSVGRLLTFVGVATAAVSLTVATRWLRSDQTDWRNESRSLLKYGLPRVPGDFALGAILALPSLAVAQISGVGEAGNIAFGNTMLALAGTAVAPFSAILLPQSSRLIASGRIAELRRSVYLTVRVFVVLALLGLAVVEIWMPFVVRNYLGVEFLPGVPQLRLLALCVLPYVIYCSLRSVVDAAYKEAVNARNAYFAVAFMLVGIGLAWRFGGGTIAVVGVAAASHFLLGILTLGTVRRLFDGSRPATRDIVAADSGDRSSRQMRVLSVIPGLPDGSCMIFARRQSAGVAAHGAVVMDFHIAERVSLSGVLREVGRLGRVIDEFDPDIVHAHYGTVTAVMCLLAARGRPVVVTFCGSDINRSEAVSSLRSAMGRFLSQIAGLCASAVVCVSEGLRRKLWWRSKRAIVLPSGVDLEVFYDRGRDAARRHLGFSADRPIVVFNCGLDPWVKNLDLANAVIEKVRSQIATSEFVVMRGDWPPDQVPWLLSAGDCVLVVSRQEGSPNIVREALACGLPIVSVDVGDVAHQIANVRNCFVCTADPDDLAAAVIHVLSSRERADGRDAAERSSTLRASTRLFSLYEELIGTRNIAAVDPGSSER